MLLSQKNKEQEIDAVRKNLIKLQEDEEILKDNPSRWVILPLKYHDIWRMFKKHQSSFWTAEDFVFSNESKNKDIKKLDNYKILSAIQNIITFSVLSESKIYGFGCLRTCDLLEYVQIPEARAYYGFECAFEVIHSELYNQLFIYFCNKDEEKNNYEYLKELLLNMMNIPAINKKKEWIEFYLNNEKCFAEKLIATSILKTIFNTCIKFVHGWCKKGKFFCNTLCVFLDKILNHVNLHADFCTLLYSKLTKAKLPCSFLKEMFLTAIETELEFAQAFIPFKDFEIEISDMLNYMQNVANATLKQIGEPAMFKTSCTIPAFMINYQEKINKLEDQCIDANKSSCLLSASSNSDFNIKNEEKQNILKLNSQQIFNDDVDF